MSGISMQVSLEMGGEVLGIVSAVPWIDALIEETTAGAVAPPSGAEPTVSITFEPHRAFQMVHAERVARGTSRRGSDVIVEDVCSTGFDMLVQSGSPVRFTFRPATPVARLAATSGRFRLRLRSALLQYPVMWWAGTRGRAPLHVSAFALHDVAPLVTGPSASGKSTLMRVAVGEGARGVTDNLCVSDGENVWGVVEPLRLDEGRGRRMSHGRREDALDGRISRLAPDRVVVLRRAATARPTVRPIDPRAAARALVTATYMAGELRRFWSFAATLALATGAGPGHPPVASVAQTLAGHLPAFELASGRPIHGDVRDLLSTRTTVGGGAA